jgi:hypothetical protein
MNGITIDKNCPLHGSRWGRGLGGYGLGPVRVWRSDHPGFTIGDPGYWMATGQPAPTRWYRLTEWIAVKTGAIPNQWRRNRRAEVAT